MHDSRKPMDTQICGDVAILHLRASHWHADSFDALSVALSDALRRAASHQVVVDLDAVKLFSSSALRALRAVHRTAEAKNGRIVAAGGGELAVSVLKFAPFILHFDDVPAALAALSPDAAAEFAKKG